MKILINSLIIVVGAAVGLVVGFALRPKPARVVETAAASQALVVSTSGVSGAPSSFTRNRVAGRTDDSPLATKLERDLSMSSGVTRWLYWLEALEKATPADCPRLARLAYHNSTLVRLVGARWVELDPQHLFNTLVTVKDSASFPSGELQRLLFDEWPKRDLDAAIAALNKNDGFGVPENWRRSFAASLVEKDPERGLRLMSEWNVANYGPRMTGVKKWAAANPRHAAEFALAHPAGYASRMVMETIGKEWARTDAAGALEFCANKRGELGSELAGAVLKSWAERDLTQAADWLAKTDSASRNRLSPALVEAWGKYDASGALQWCQANLTGTTFANAAAALVKGAAAGDLVGAADLVASLPPSRARGDAATVVMQKWLPDYSSDKPVPPEATAWLVRLDSESIKRVLEQEQWRWAESDPRSLMAFVASLGSEQVPPQTYSTLARQIARKNPEEALDWANRAPENHRLSAGNDAFSEWLRSQPESARQWLHKLPADDLRRGPFFQNFVSTIAHDPNGAQQLAALTPAEQVTARALLEKMSLSAERRQTLLDALKPR